MDLAATNWLDHHNIIKVKDFGTAKYLDEEGKEVNISYMVTDLAEKGEMFDIIANTGSLNEYFARRVMKQLFKAVGYMHTKGIAHRDLKLENMLLDNDFNIKIIDFGFSSPLLAKDGKNLLETVCGTLGYMAPEIVAGKKYLGVKADMFALGVLMFTLLAARPPFQLATPGDQLYKFIAEGNH